MNNETKVLLALLRDYIKQIPSDESLTGDIDWQLLIKTANSNNVLPFVYHQIKKFNIDPKYIIYMKNTVIHGSSNQIQMTNSLNEIIEAFEIANIDYYVLKGVILADLYPHPEYRYSCDIDIHIDESKIEEAIEVLENNNYHRVLNMESESDYKFKTPENHLIELHYKLFDEFEKKHHELIKDLQLDKKEKLIMVNINGKNIVTLNSDNFLIYILCHLTVHFISTGINLRYLTDISFFVNKNIKQLNFDYIMTTLEKFCIDNFAKSLLNICDKHLGMEPIPINYDIFDETVIATLIYDIVEKQLDYDPTKSYAENNYDKMYGRILYYRDKKSVVFNMIFPNVKSLKIQYAYAKKHKLLLPVAWLHRLIKHFINIIIKSSSKNISEKMKESIDRSILLKELDLL